MQGLHERRGNKPPSISQIQARVFPSDPQLLKCHPASVCISANLSRATTTTVGTKRPPEALILPRPTVCYLVFKKCIPACAWGKYFQNILEASGMDKCFQHHRPLLQDFCFWGVFGLFLGFFICHELLHMLSGPPAKPNETQTRPPRLRATS